MNSNSLLRGLWRVALTSWALLVCAEAGAAGNQWTNGVSSLWRVSTNWAAAHPPSLLDTVAITNASTKTVTIDSATPAANLSVGNLTVSAPSGSTNTLRLVDLSTAGALTSSGTVRIDSRGVLSLTNSSFAAQSTFDINAGTVVLDGGLLDTTINFVDVRLGRLYGATGTALLNGGALKCFGFRLGDASGSPGICTVNGGTLWCGSVLDMGEAPNSPGTLSLLSGQVIATNDVTRVGNLGQGQYNQSGGSANFSFWSIADNAAGTANISGGQVTITPGGSLDVVRVGNFGTGQLNISGSAWVWARGEFHVADNPGIQGSVLMTGGTLIATNGMVAIGRYGMGDMTITNATACWTNTSVGRHDGATGTLNIQQGASVYTDDLSIGRFANGTGFVNISGGLLSLTNDSLWVGREGSGNLAVSDGTVRAKCIFVGMSEDGTNTPQGTAVFSGGTTAVSSNLTIGTSLLSTGQVSVLGGVLAVTNSSHTGLLNIADGNFTINQGTVLADLVVLTNAQGNFSFPAGKLRAAALTVATGAPFVLGDGVQPATLELAGGASTFANGLVISSNAVVTGCGTLVGAVVNNGIISTNCGGSILIQSVKKAGNIVTISFSTINGTTNVLEFKNTLSEPTWTSLLPGVAGNGSVLTQQDTTATNRSRFYRIRAQ